MFFRLRPLSILWIAAVVFCQSTLAHVPERTGVVIVGGGITALVAAYKLKQQGIPFHILEKNPYVGGRVATAFYTVKGEKLYANSVMEEYWESNPIVPLLQELDLPLKPSESISSIVLDGKIEAYLPGERKQEFLKRVLGTQRFRRLKHFEKNTLRVLKKVSKHEAGGLPPRLRRLTELSFASWVLKQRLPKKVSDWIRISVEAEIGRPWNQISALDGIAEYSIFLGQGERAFQVIGGNQVLIQKLIEKIGADSISSNILVHRFEIKPNEVLVHYRDRTTNEVRQINASFGVSTIPLHQLNQVQFSPALPQAKIEAIRTLKWGTYFKAHVIVSPEAEKYYSVSGQSLLPLLSDSDLGVIYDQLAEESSKTRILTLLLLGKSAQKLHHKSRTEAEEFIRGRLEQFWPGISSEIFGIELYADYPRSIAAWPPGRSRFDALSDAVRTPEHRFYLAGDFTRSSHSDGAVQSALDVIKDILSKLRRPQDPHSCERLLK
ncbi:MAG: FAD-dependent oxidoreductase [Bdellovibrionota bacterium]